MLAMALVYLFVARMGAKASGDGLAGQALPFVAGAYIWISIHVRPEGTCKPQPKKRCPSMPAPAVS